MQLIPFTLRITVYADRPYGTSTAVLRGQDFDFAAQAGEQHIRRAQVPITLRRMVRIRLSLPRRAAAAKVRSPMSIVATRLRHAAYLNISEQSPPPKRD